MSSPGRSALRSPAALVLVGLVVLLLVAGIVGRLGDEAPRAAAASGEGGVGASAPPRVTAPPAPPAPFEVAPATAPIPLKPTLPGGGRRVFGDHRFLIAFYGTAGTGALGVLGATDPDAMQQRLMRAALPFREPGERLQPVYELIVTVADRSPGPDGDYSHDIARPLVEQYLRAAHRNGALLLLDIQPGRASFPAVARRWTWALTDPWVGLALDPEWRMNRHQVPASAIGSVGAAEVNATSLWLSRLVEREGLPEKLFVLHQFRLSMIPDIAGVVHRPGLAMVQHADGFGTREQKLSTYHAITRPEQFRQGFKLFYRVDRHRFTPQDVRRIEPAVSFVSYQ